MWEFCFFLFKEKHDNSKKKPFNMIKIKLHCRLSARFNEDRSLKWSKEAEASVAASAAAVTSFIEASLNYASARTIRETTLAWRASPCSCTIERECFFIALLLQWTTNTRLIVRNSDLFIATSKWILHRLGEGNKGVSGVDVKCP